jgi:hypothetical protein
VANCSTVGACVREPLSAPGVLGASKEAVVVFGFFRLMLSQIGARLASLDPTRAAGWGSLWGSAGGANWRASTTYQKAIIVRIRPRPSLRSYTLVVRPHRPAWPRTRPFQGRDTGSNPVGVIFRGSAPWLCSTSQPHRARARGGGFAPHLGSAAGLRTVKSVCAAAGTCSAYEVNPCGLDRIVLHSQRAGLMALGTRVLKAVVVPGRSRQRSPLPHCPRQRLGWWPPRA